MRSFVLLVIAIHFPAILLSVIPFSVIPFSVILFFPAKAAFACPIDSRGCAKPQTDIAHVFFYLEASGDSHDTALSALERARTSLQESVKSFDISRVKLGLSSPESVSNEDPKLFQVGQFGAVEYRIRTDGESEDKIERSLAELIDAVIAAGVKPISPTSSISSFDNFGGRDSFGFKNHSDLNINGNFVLFTVSKVSPYLDNAIQDALSRISRMAKVFGSLINDEPKGLDDLAISYDAEIRPWKNLHFGPVSPTLDDVNVYVSLKADVRFSHALLATKSDNGGHSHARDHAGTERTIAATGRGRVVVPIEKALLHTRLQVTAEKVTLCLDQLEKELLELKHNKDLAGENISASGIGFRVRDEYSYSHSPGFADLLAGKASDGPSITKIISCYRNLSIYVNRANGEKIDQFSARVAKMVTLIPRPAASGRATFSIAGSDDPKVYYFSHDLAALITDLLESAFSDAKAKAQQLAKIEKGSLGDVVTIHPEGRIGIEELMDSVVLGNEYSWNQGLSLTPGTTEQELRTELMVTFSFK